MVAVESDLACGLPALYFHFTKASYAIVSLFLGLQSPCAGEELWHAGWAQKVQHLQKRRQRLCKASGFAAFCAGRIAGRNVPQLGAYKLCMAAIEGLGFRV